MTDEIAEDFRLNSNNDYSVEEYSFEPTSNMFSFETCSNPEIFDK